MQSKAADERSQASQDRRATAGGSTGCGRARQHQGFEPVGGRGDWRHFHAGGHTLGVRGAPAGPESAGLQGEG